MPAGREAQASRPKAGPGAAWDKLELSMQLLGPRSLSSPAQLAREGLRERCTFRSWGPTPPRKLLELPWREAQPAERCSSEGLVGQLAGKLKLREGRPQSWELHRSSQFAAVVEFRARASFLQDQVQRVARYWQEKAWELCDFKAASAIKLISQS